MSRKSLRGVRVLLVCGVVVLGGAMGTNADWLSSDGDFGVQTLNAPLGAPWNDFGGGGSQVVKSTSQSPFTNAFAGNGKGANTAALNGNPYFVNSFTAIPGNATGFVYLNADFRNTSNDTDGYVLAVSNGSFQHALLLSIRGDNGLQAGTGNGMGGVNWASVLSPVVNTWYNVQVTLDLTNQSYSGKVTPFGGAAVTIVGGSFISPSVGITNIFSDGGNDSTYLVAPAHDIDNFGLSNTPIPGVPEPGMVALLTSGLIGLLAYAWRRRR